MTGVCHVAALAYRSGTVDKTWGRNAVRQLPCCGAALKRVGGQKDGRVARCLARGSEVAKGTAKISCLEEEPSALCLGLSRQHTKGWN